MTDEDKKELTKYLDEELNLGLVGLPYTFEGKTYSNRTFTTDADFLALCRKAVEFVEALIMHRDNGVDLEAEGRIYNWIDEYQQLCKEEK